VATTPAKRACLVCGTQLADDSPYCPVCALRGVLEAQSNSVSDISSELRFEHYQVLRNQDGKPLELGHGGVGVTYKAIDTIAVPHWSGPYRYLQHLWGRIARSMGASSGRSKEAVSQARFC
jgi:hypothetical protein